MRLSWQLFRELEYWSVEELRSGIAPLCLIVLSLVTQLADEPTSGLDPYTSLRLMDFLRTRLVENPNVCVTIMIIIHQPRVEIMRYFDHLVLLAPISQRQHYWQGPPCALITAVRTETGG